MKLSVESEKINPAIKDLYAVNVRVIWSAFKSEGAAFWWLCAYFILEYVRPASLYPIIDILPWTQIALLFALYYAFKAKDITMVNNPANGLLLSFYLMVVLSSIFAFQSYVSWEKLDIALNWVIIYFLFISVINTEKRFFLFLIVFLLINFKMSQHGFFSFASRGFSYARWGVVGSPGWFHDSGDFGIAMIIFSPLAIAFAVTFREHWGRYKKWFFYFVPFTGLVTIIATSSRGAQLGLVAMGLWFVLKTKLGLKAILGALVIGLLLYLMLPSEMLVEFQSAGDDGTSRDRLAHWGFGIDVALSNPIFGVGYENWLAYCDFKNPDGLGYKGWCRLPHNTYITAAAEIGLIGFSLYLIMALFIFKLNATTRLAAKNNNFVYNVTHALDAGLFGYLIATVFFTTLFYPLFWLHLAMSVSLYQISGCAIKQKKCNQM